MTMAPHEAGSALSSSPGTVRCGHPKGVIVIRAFPNKEENKGYEAGCPVDY